MNQRLFIVACILLVMLCFLTGYWMFSAPAVAPDDPPAGTQLAGTAPAAPVTIPELPPEPAPPVAPGGRGFARGALAPTSETNRARYAQFAATAHAMAGKLDVYFVGDSMVDFWLARYKDNWDQNFSSWRVGNFGMSGNRTQDILYRLDAGEIDGVNPKVIVLMIGTNNLSTLGAGNNAGAAQEVARGVDAVVQKLHAKAPAAKILLMGVTPRFNSGPPAAGGFTATSPGRTTLAPMRGIDELNAELESLVTRNHDQAFTLRFLNINRKLTGPDGAPLPGMLMADNFHLAEPAYQVWADSLKPILTEWLGSPAR
jgi:lysophospholipase L1-like esterase